jgi:hypothetical protein
VAWKQNIVKCSPSTSVISWSRKSHRDEYSSIGTSQDATISSFWAKGFSPSDDHLLSPLLQGIANMSTHRDGWVGTSLIDDRQCFRFGVAALSP